MKRFFLWLLTWAWIALAQAQPQTIRRLEYFYDTDPGYGLGLSLTFNPQSANATQSFVFSTAGLSLGRHWLYIRTQNSKGQWSQTIRKSVNIVKGRQNRVVAAEYFFDTDPGYGNGTSFSFFAPDSIVNALVQNEAMANLSFGPHYLYFRTKDANGVWSHTSRKWVLKKRDEQNNKVKRVEYFFGSEDPGVGSASKVAIQNPASSGTFAAFVPAAIVPNGLDTLFIRVIDSLGYYSHTVWRRVTNFNVIPFINGTLALGNETICSGGDPLPITFSISSEALQGPIQYRWVYKDGVHTSSGAYPGTWIPAPGANASSQTYDPPVGLATTRTYACYVQSGSGNAWATNVRVITVQTVATPSITSSNTPNTNFTFCDRGVLDAGPAGTYEWRRNNQVLTGRTSDTLNITTGGSYTAVLIQNGCSSNPSPAIAAVVNATPDQPTVAVSGPTTFCAGGRVVLRSSSNSGNVWSNNSTLDSLVVTTSGTFTVRVVANGCSSQVSNPSVTVTVNPIPNVIASSNPVSICSGQSSTLSANSSIAGTSFSWQPAIPGNGIVNPSDTTVYIVSGTAAGCTGSDTLTLIVRPTPATPTIIYNAGNGTITSSAATGNQWYNGPNPIAGQTGSVLNLNTGIGGSYYTIVTSANGCVSQPSDTITLVSNLDLENQVGDLKVYPNPSRGSFFIESQNLGKGARIRLYDALGKEVFAENLSTEKTEFRLRLPAGLYKVQVQNGQKSWQSSLVFD